MNDYILALEQWGSLNRGMIARGYPSQSAHLQTPGGGDKSEPDWSEDVKKINKILIELRAHNQIIYKIISVFAQYPELTDKERIKKVNINRSQYYEKKKEGLYFVECRF